ncbi:MAG: type I methionyl aminopeptidase [Bacteroidales bacterium]|nr:type I methionyl aminopeptidase [Bacteroidales bacterium]
MIHTKTSEEINEMKVSALMVGETLAEIAKVIKPGVTTLALDKLAEEFIRSKGAVPTFKGYGGFPASLCISINEVVVHGIPGKREIQEGDVISVDCGCTFNNWVGDSAYTFAVKGIKEEDRQLLRVTKESLYKAIDKCVVGKRLGDIGDAVQSYCESFGYGVVRELCGHGLGHVMHEEPNVLNYGRKGTGAKLREGMTIAIEPMITLGNKEVVFHNDGWTCTTVDNSTAAHYEHDVAITKNGPIVLSSFQKIEDAIKENDNLELIN